jgi:hypothetical protein
MVTRVTARSRTPHEHGGMTIPDAAENLMEFLRTAVGPGQEAEIAINHDLNALLVFVDGEVALTCSLDELKNGLMPRN